MTALVIPFPEARTIAYRFDGGWIVSSGGERLNLVRANIRLQSIDRIIGRLERAGNVAGVAEQQTERADLVRAIEKMGVE
ncbi:hypothetical protein [Asticcacaulis endophyticus]|uniref:Uncharacterized protein n=1 Tax=Asticcacaulis endophyticus TaxID=1395890 RepID=A0A918UN55_9CAUL|nr:hypothetical protein [Asticcacaulis endophyticus]GGZ21987.1 hypothetical protein GCM10011273_03490 [Asticcacaulis endophyticus]